MLHFYTILELSFLPSFLTQKHDTHIHFFSLSLLQTLSNSSSYFLLSHSSRVTGGAGGRRWQGCHLQHFPNPSSFFPPLFFVQYQRRRGRFTTTGWRFLRIKETIWMLGNLCYSFPFLSCISKWNLLGFLSWVKGNFENATIF